jgi:mycothione reductase
MRKFDLIVIGSGAGLIVANGSARKGLKTALIEKSAVGGTCLNRGCIPSKIVIHSADVADTINNSKTFGINSKIEKIRFKQVTDRANNLVDDDSMSIETSLTSRKNLVFIKGVAKFVDKYTIEVNGEKLLGKKVVIAAGARPRIPRISGLDKVPFMTSTEALRQTKQPKSLIVIGGGYIGSELGNFYAALGTKVTILQKGKSLISREDKDVADLFTKLWKKRHTVITNADIKDISKQGRKIIVHVRSGDKKYKITGEKLLVSTGITPNTDILEIENVGMKTCPKGHISVNSFLETSIKNIWAFGDITEGYFFRHSANLEAKFILNNIFGKKKKVDYYPMPHAIFCNPQIAGVGLSEQEVIGQKIDYVIGKEYYKNTGMGAALHEEDGFVKFIVARKSREILGCHIIGPEASILIHEVLVAMKANRKKALEIIKDTVHIHPALSEVVQRAAWKVGM